MSETIQSLSICCPSATGKCINHCKTCTARQHANPYFNKYDSSRENCYEYWEDVIKRMEYAQRKGCETLMLTGSNEPQQNRRWLESLYLAMKSLSKPFLNIEIQTTGAFINHDYLVFLKKIGITTLAVSTFNIFDDELNRYVIECADKNLNLYKLCDDANSVGLNIRICINVTDYMTSSSFKTNTEYLKKIDRLIECKPYAITYDFLESNLSAADNLSGDEFYEEMKRLLLRCSELHANQVTFRKMWSNSGTPEDKWISKNCKYSDTILSTVNTVIKNRGHFICKLPYGAARYDYSGFSVVVDMDSMAKNEENINLKYYIIRENGKMYSSWDSPASLVF